MEVDQAQLLVLVKELAEGTLKLRIKLQEQEQRIARLEYVMANPPIYSTTNAIASTQLARPSESIIYAQRDIIGE